MASPGAVWFLAITVSVICLCDNIGPDLAASRAWLVGEHDKTKAPLECSICECLMDTKPDLAPGTPAPFSPLNSPAHSHPKDHEGSFSEKRHRRNVWEENIIAALKETSLRKKHSRTTSREIRRSSCRDIFLLTSKRGQTACPQHS